MDERRIDKQQGEDESVGEDERCVEDRVSSGSDIDLRKDKGNQRSGAELIEPVGEIIELRGAVVSGEIEDDRDDGDERECGNGDGSEPGAGKAF